MTSYKFLCNTKEDTQALGEYLGAAVKGGETFAFMSDLGGGKTTFVKGLARGMGVTNVVQSPSFTISLLHKAARGLELHHFDFYRLDEPGIMRAELGESLHQKNAVVALEWGDVVYDILPGDLIKVNLTLASDEQRLITIGCPAIHQHLHVALGRYQQQRGLA